MSYTSEKTDTTLEAVVNKRFKTIKLEFYNKSLSGKPPELYTTLILTDVNVTTVDLPDAAKKQVRPNGYFYGHPYMFKFKSMQEKKPGYKGNIF